MPQREEHFGSMYFAGEFRIYEGLTYLRTEGDRHVFKLPMPHLGHEQFKGCSGAPILNTVGTPVALVTGGEQSSGEIYAVSLDRYRIALDVLVEASQGQ